MGFPTVEDQTPASLAKHQPPRHQRNKKLWARGKRKALRVLKVCLRLPLFFSSPYSTSSSFVLLLGFIGDFGALFLLLLALLLLIFLWAIRLETPCQRAFSKGLPLLNSSWTSGSEFPKRTPPRDSWRSDPKGSFGSRASAVTPAGLQ